MSRGDPQVLVTHPGRQHSHQAALALARGGMLAGYWAGVPIVDSHLRRLPGRLRRSVRYAPVPLPDGKVRWFPAVPALRRLGDRLLPRAVAAWNDYAACIWFDRWVAGELGASSADAVIGCEISALATFRRAKRLGLVTILDAPAIHHQAQDRLHSYFEPAGLHQRITMRKDAEITVADHVVTVSELARQTYLDAGVPEEQVHAVRLGADLDVFRPPANVMPGEEFVFLFAGATIHRKGFDLLVEAFERVRARGVSVRLEVAGPKGDAWPIGRAVEGLVHLGELPQGGLASRMHAADCLVLPSRQDSFGMVVAEALAAGLPCLVSDMVGAATLVTEGVTGWVVAGGTGSALAERMSWCAENRSIVRSMRPACRAAAEAATWEAYHARFAALVRRLVGVSG